MSKAKKKKKPAWPGKIKRWNRDSSKDQQYAKDRECRMYKGVKQKMATGGARV